MILTETMIDEIKAAAKTIGEYGRITIISTGDHIDITAETRRRIYSLPEKDKRD